MIKSRVGEIRTMNNGMDAEIIEYITVKDMTVKFSDGTVVEHVRYGNFKQGGITNPNVKKPSFQGERSKRQRLERIGEKRIAKNGMEMEIIEYYSQRNITVKFEDGYIANNVRYDHFLAGCVKNENIKTIQIQNMSQKIGETRVVKGQEVKIVGYVDKNNITVQWPDGVTKEVAYNRFKKGNIKRPFVPSDYIGLSSFTNGNHEKMIIVAASSATNLTVQFEDGTVVEHITMRQFREGSAINPNNTKGRCGGNKIWTTHLGEEGISSKGQKMKIIRYKDTKDIDVEFENGVVVTHKSYECFQKGQILNPGYYVGEEFRQTNGMSFKVLGYGERSYQVLWEDGTNADVYKPRITLGNIAHPTLQGRANGSLLCFSTRQIVFADGDAVYYPCKCNICGQEDIMTPQQMIRHWETADGHKK